VGDLKWVRAHHDTVRGRISSEWRREAGRFTWQVRVPVGATATVHVPGKAATEGGKAAREAAGITVLREEPGLTVLQVGSGSYRFGSALDR
jgi:alpha-L-rhamnosidase